VMTKNHLPGTIKIWPGVAEELLGSKAYYIRDGYFKGIDAVLFSHVGDNLGASYGGYSTSGLVSVQYNFHGESAHSAAAPWRGRSALDAVELMDVGWNFRREHLRLQQRSHYVIPTAATSRMWCRKAPQSGITFVRPIIRTLKSCGRSATIWLPVLPR
jgi:aminobenzoyl-glutamate utilization protein B